MDKTFKIICLVILAIVAIGVFILMGIGIKNSSKNKVKNTSSKTSTNTAKTEDTTSDEGEKKMTDIDYAAAAEKQMALPSKGEEIAIIKVKDYGTMKAKFFPEVAPKAVENFKTHSKNGYYNGLTFHRVINDFMIQGGDPSGNGTGGESIWGEGFGPELDYELVPYRGSLCMAMSSLPNSIGSQFFITQAKFSEKNNSIWESSIPVTLMNQYKKYGGYLSLYMQYTVFGQVYEGLDVLDSIAAVETNSNDKPVKDVIIENITITAY